MDTSIKPTVSDSKTTEYDVKFVLANTENYEVVEGLKSTVKVDKAPTEITGTERYEKLLGDENFTLDAASDKNLPLTYEVTSGDSVSVTEDDTVKINGIGESVITVSSSNENYVDARLDVVVNVEQNIIKPIVEEPTATDIYVGQSLADSVFFGNASVDGKYEWVDNTIKPTLEDSEKTEYDVKFVPDDVTKYEVVEGLKSTVKVLEKPAEETQEPTVEPDKPTEETQEPTVEPDKPTEETQEPTVEPDKPTEETQEPTVEPDKPTYKTQEPTVGPDKPTEETQEPTVEQDKPTEETQEPTVEPDKPTEETQEPTVEPDKPTEETQEPTVEPDKPITIAPPIFKPSEPSDPIEEPDRSVEIGEIKTSDIVYGDSLTVSIITGESSVPGKFVWENDAIIPNIEDSETTQYPVKFIPDDLDKYDVVEGLTAVVRVFSGSNGLKTRILM